MQGCHERRGSYEDGIVTSHYASGGSAVTRAGLSRGCDCNVSLCKWWVCFDEGGIVTRGVVVAGAEV